MFRMFIPTLTFPKALRLSDTAQIRRIIGIDPGLASSGWGIVEYECQRVRYIAHGCIETEAGCIHAERLFFIYTRISEILEIYRPSEAAVEILYFGKNVTSAIAVAEARGVLCMALAQRGIPVHEYTPNAIKQAVLGRGAADKRQIQEMVRMILGLDAAPRPDHSADALGAAVCCAHSVKGF
jgi:crossover junction endodeoxyribonuclease RuvC